MSLSPETEILIRMLADPSAWKQDGASSMTHKYGLRLCVYDKEPTLHVFAQRDKVFLLVPEADWKYFVENHYNPARAVVAAREAVEDTQASKTLLAELQSEFVTKPHRFKY